MRICKQCHKPSGRDVCSSCRKIKNIFINRQLNVPGPSDPKNKAWIEAVRNQLFRS
jgi:hypothetical protein